MRRPKLTFPFLLAFLIAPALSVFFHGLESSTSFGRAGFGTALLLASNENSLELYERGRERLAEQQYRDAVALFEAVTQMEHELDERDVTFHREVSRLRLAKVQGDQNATRLARLALLGLIERGMDDWGARAVKELVLAGLGHDADVARHVPSVLSRWEMSPQVEDATREYTELFEALIDRNYGYSGYHSASLLRMWENLVGIGAAREDLVNLAALVLEGTPMGTPRPTGRRGRWQPSSYPPDLVKHVSLTVLEFDPKAPAWLLASAHLHLGDIAEREGRLREAEEHFRTVESMGAAGESHAMQTARDRWLELTKPAIQLNGSVLFAPGSQHALNVHWRNLASWSIEVSRLDVKRDVAPSQDTSKAHGPLDGFLKGKGTKVLGIDRTDEAEAAARREDTGTPQPHQRRQDTVWLEPLTPGLYRAVLSGTSAQRGLEVEPVSFVFQVSTAGVTYQVVTGESGHELEFWLVDMKTGAPYGGAELDTWTTPWRGGNQPLAWMSRKVKTDANGLARLPVSDQRDLVVVAGQVGDQPILATGIRAYRNFHSGGTQAAMMLVTDRPLYRPDETVYLQAFVRERDLTRRTSTVPSFSTVELIITAPDGSEFLKQELELNANGAVELDVEIPSRPSLGQYQVSLRHSNDSWIGGGGFQVDEYRLPEFVVSAALDGDKRYVLGDDLEIEISAEYLFGGPVAGSAEIVVRRTPVWVWWHPWSKYSYLRQDVSQRIAPPYWGGGGEEVMRVTRALDADGKLALTVPTDMRASSPQDYQYTVEARVTDSSRREEMGSTTVKVTQRELYAYLSPERHLVAPGDEARVNLRVQDAMDRPAQISGTWSLHWQSKTDETDEIFERSISTGEDGTALLTFKPDRAGYYTAQFKTKDARGNEVVASTTVWCADARTNSIVHSAGSLQLISEQEEFLEGETAKVLLVSDTAGIPVYVSRFFSGGVETQVLKMEGTVKLLEIPIDDMHRPYFYLQAAQAHDFRLHQATLQVVAPMVERALTLTVDMGEESYAPGETIDLAVTARDGLGNPISTPVTVAVVDEAVLAIMPRQLVDPNEIFNRFDVPRPGDLPVHAQMLGGYRDTKKDGGKREQEGDEFSGDQVRRLGQASGALASRQEMDMLADAPMAMEAKAGRARNVAAPVPASQGVGGAEPVKVRSDFRTTALWQTGVVTDAQGNASVEFKLPESLTKWEALAVALTPDSKGGLATGTTRTRKNLMVRLNHPRVFREKDRILFAATVHNEGDEDLSVRVDLQVDALNVQGGAKTITVAAHDQAQVEWWANVPVDSAELNFVRNEETKRLYMLPSQAEVTVTARAADQSDAFVRSVKLLPFGTAQRLVAAVEAGPGVTQLKVDLPGERLTAAEVATLTLSPSVLSACVDALPYLADFPYGCTEQTLSRFVPAVAVRAAANAMGVKSKRIDPELDEKIAQGVRRIKDHQNGDGGWGWWSNEQSQPYMTAYVLIALAQAKDAGVRGVDDMLSQGYEAMRGMLTNLERNADDMAYALYAMAAAESAGTDELRVRPDELMQRYAGRLFKDRDELSDYSRALLASYVHAAGQAENASLLLRSLDDTAQIDDEYDTVHWGKRRGYWWRGSGAVESTAFALQAYAVIDPDHANFRRAARWLVTNREGSRWNSTRSTAHAIYSLVDFARVSGELDARYTMVVSLQGREIARMEVDPSTLIDGGGEFGIPSDLLRDGFNELELSLEGTGVCYASVAVDTYTRMEDPQPTKNILGVTRELVRLRPLRTLGGSILQIEEPMDEGATVASGDRIRVRLTLTAHNDLEYLAIEDPRPAGTEPVDRLSGWFHSGSVSGRREVRDEQTTFFVSRLTQGEHILEYELRAESPGTYFVLPARAGAMYVPDVVGTSGMDEVLVGAGDVAEGAR